MIADLQARPLTKRHCLDLAPRIREADLVDLSTHRGDPLAALIESRGLGGAYGVWDGETIIGAGGWTFAGAVWTLWTDLSLSQYKGLMRRVPCWAHFLAMASGCRRLENAFLQGNTVTEKWLRATRCVDILEDQPLTWDNKTFIPFVLKPLEQLPDV